MKKTESTKDQVYIQLTIQFAWDMCFQDLEFCQTQDILGELRQLIHPTYKLDLVLKLKNFQKIQAVCLT